MNTMPGFTADASLSEARLHYWQQSGGATAAFAVQAALRIGGLHATCGNCICDPGQCCTATSAGCKCEACGPPGGFGGGGVLTLG
jgi:hypothetical protein